jgi:hypothetical protein
VSDSILNRRAPIPELACQTHFLAPIIPSVTHTFPVVFISHLAHVAIRRRTPRSTPICSDMMSHACPIDLTVSANFCVYLPFPIAPHPKSNFSVLLIHLHLILLLNIWISTRPSSSNRTIFQCVSDPTPKMACFFYLHLTLIH